MRLLFIIGKKKCWWLTKHANSIVRKRVFIQQFATPDFQISTSNRSDTSLVVLLLLWKWVKFYYGQFEVSLCIVSTGSTTLVFRRTVPFANHSWPWWGLGARCCRVSIIVRVNSNCCHVYMSLLRLWFLRVSAPAAVGSALQAYRHAQRTWWLACIFVGFLFPYLDVRYFLRFNISRTLETLCFKSYSICFARRAILGQLGFSVGFFIYTHLSNFYINYLASRSGLPCLRAHSLKISLTFI